MQISISLQERFGKLWFFEGLKMCQNLDANMEGFCLYYFGDEVTKSLLHI